MPNLLGPGTYESLTIIGTRIEEGKTPDEPTIVITLADPDTVDHDRPTVLSHFLYTSDKAAKRTAQALRAYGWDPTENEWAIGFFADEKNSLIGTTVKDVVIEMETYTNKAGETKTSPKIKKVGNTSFGFGMSNAEAKSVQTAFQRRMRLKNAQSFADDLPGYDTPPAGAPNPTADDTVPF